MKQNRVHLTPVYDHVCSAITPSASVAYTSDKLFQINTVPSRLLTQLSLVNTLMIARTSSNLVADRSEAGRRPVADQLARASSLLES